MRERFHKRVGPFRLQEIAEFIGVSCAEGGDKTIEDIAALDLAGSQDLAFLDNKKYVSQARLTKAGAVIIHEKFAAELPEGVSALISPMPHASYALALQMFYPQHTSSGKVSDQAIVHEDVKIGKNVEIQAGAVIKTGAQISDNVIIKHNAVIGENVVIGEASVIGEGVMIQCAMLGKGVILHQNASIGQDGFGFAWDGKKVLKVPQIGSVIIGDYVEIGAGTTIDRGSLGNTEIGDMTKIDNLVQIAHNVKIGKCCQIVSQSGVAGSTKLGNGVIVGGQAGFVGHIEVADGVTVAARAGVSKTVEEKGITLSGFPAIPIEKWRKMQVAMSRLTQNKKTKGNS